MLIIFDLDGTLIDSSTDLAISMNATREHFGLERLDPKLIYSYVGNGAEVLVRRAMGPGTPEDRVREAHAFFLRFYRKHALEHTKLFPGVREAVLQLCHQDHALTVLTNKPVRISFDIMAALGLGECFGRVYGGDSFPRKKPDPVGIRTLMDESNLDATQTLMVGDSAVDVQTARAAGVRCCGVAWGFQPESFQGNPPDWVIERPDEILSIVSQCESLSQIRS